MVYELHLKKAIILKRNKMNKLKSIILNQDANMCNCIFYYNTMTVLGIS